MSKDDYLEDMEDPFDMDENGMMVFNSNKKKKS